MLIAIVNHSDHFAPASKHPVLGLIAQACTMQIHRHVAPLWERTPWSVQFYQDASMVPAGVSPLVFFDDSDQPGALGYHDFDPKGMPYGRVFVQTLLQYGATETLGPNSISVTASHECCEAFIDPDCNSWKQSRSGTLTIEEVCDAVEGDSYTIPVAAGTSVAVSNFLLPDYFRWQPRTANYDFLGLLRGPFPAMTPGGYVSTMAPGADGQLTGKLVQHYGPNYPEWKKAMKAHPASRTARHARALLPHFQPSIDAPFDVTKEPTLT